MSDLHMPGAGDGLTVVSAMRHANPDIGVMTIADEIDSQLSQAMKS